MVKIDVELRKEEAFVFENIEDASSFEENPKLNFCFFPEEADDGNETLNVEIVGEIPKADDFCFVEVRRDDNVVALNYRVMFSVVIKDDYTEDDFDEWAYDQGGWSTVRCEPEGYEFDFSEDFEGAAYLGSKNEYGISFSEFYS